MTTYSQTAEVRPTRRRYMILALIFATVVINYMDRLNISVASTELAAELSLTSVQMGLIFSAFGWTYSTLQIPGGICVDLIKARLLYPFILVAWSLATAVQGLVGSFAALIGCRMAIGAFEAPSYPCNNRIVTTWFPESERASAIAVYTSGQFVGMAFLMPVLALLQSQFGWRGLFIISGVIGILWAVVFYLIYREPKEHSGVNAQELEYISGAPELEPQASEEERSAFSKGDLLGVFSQRKLWGIFIGQFCLGGTFIFFMTWFPTYLVSYRGLDFIKSGFLGSLPFFAAFVGVIVSGFLSDYLHRRGVSVEVARKTPIIAGLALSSAIVGANYTDDTFWIITFLSIAFFGNGLASIAWIFVSLLSPVRLVGLVGGCFNFIGGLSAVVVPLVIGFLVDEGSFEPALIFIAGLAMLGCLSYLFLVGKIERVEIGDRLHDAPTQ